MKRFTALASALLLTFAFCLSAFSQSPGSARGGSPATKTSVDDSEVSSTFDKNKNETKLEFGLLEIGGVSPQRLLLSASTTFPGEKIRSQPKDIIFIISVVSPGGYKYPDIMKLKVKADGKDLPETVILNLDKRQLDESQFAETIGTRMKYEVFQKISQAKTVEMQFENTKFQLTSDHLRRFADLVKLTQVN